MKTELTVIEFAQTFILKNMSKIYRHIKAGKLDTSVVKGKLKIKVNDRALDFVENYYQNGNGNPTEYKYEQERQKIINQYREQINAEDGAFRF